MQNYRLQIQLLQVAGDGLFCQIVMNDRLLPFAGRKVTASGKVFERGGSSAIVIEKIEAQK